MTKYYLLWFFKLWPKQDDVLLIDGQIIRLNNWIPNSILSVIIINSILLLFYSGYRQTILLVKRRAPLLKRVKYSIIHYANVYIYVNAFKQRTSQKMHKRVKRNETEKTV